MSDSNTQIHISILDPEAYYRPGQQINGNVTINTAGGQSLTFAALRLVWTGRIVTQLAGQVDRKEYFNQVFHLDPNNDTFVQSADISSSAPSTLLQVDGQIIFPFQVTLPTDRLLPSSFEINDTMMGALSNVEYMVEVSLDHQTFDPMPIKTRSAILVMVAPSSVSESITPSTHQQQQQTSEKTYLSTVLQDRAEYRTAARITVPCKTSSRGAIIPVVVHIWHDCQYNRRNGISLSLVRMCKIHCGERTEILSKDLFTVTRDLELTSRTGYSVQTLSETLQIPYDTVPSVTNDQGELASIEYKVILAVHAHPGALYTELPSTSTTTAMQYMLVECPLYIDTTTQQHIIFGNNKSDQQVSSPGTPIYPDSSKITRGDTSRFASSNITVPFKDSNKKMTSRMKGMFRRRSKLEPTNGVPALNDSNGDNESIVTLTNNNNKDKDKDKDKESIKGTSSFRQVMSSLRPRNNSNSNIAAATAAVAAISAGPTTVSNGNGNTTTKPQSRASSIISSQIQSTSLQTSPPQSINSSITDLSKRPIPPKPITPLPPPPPPSAILASDTSPITSTEDISKPLSSPSDPPPANSSPTSIISPPPSYSEPREVPLSTPSPPTTQSPSTPSPPTVIRSKSIHERALPTINSAPKPLVQEEQPSEPIPGLDGGGVHYFDMFPDSDEENETHNTSNTKDVTNRIDEAVLVSPTASTQTGTMGGRDDQTEITTTTLDSSNQPRYFNLFPDDDLTDEEEVATKQQAVRENLRTVYPDVDNKLDEVNVSDSEPDSDSEEEMDLISMMARRERRIERARKRRD